MAEEENKKHEEKENKAEEKKEEKRKKQKKKKGKARREEARERRKRKEVCRVHNPFGKEVQADSQIQEDAKSNKDNKRIPGQAYEAL